MLVTRQEKIATDKRSSLFWTREVFYNIKFCLGWGVNPESFIYFLSLYHLSKESEAGLLNI
jgi:hypothetical protein